MTAAARLPDNAPFAPDAIVQLNEVIGRSTASQRTWLAGFLAGLEAAHGAGAVAAAPVVKPKLTILFATESGNSEALALGAKRDAAKLGFAARVLDAADATPAALKAAGNLLVIASTWGEGDAPQRAASFTGALMADDAPRLEGLRYAVLALGDRAYAQFCETGRSIDLRLEALGAVRAAPRVECDLDYETVAAGWLATTLAELRGPDTKGGPDNDSVIHVDFGAPAAGAVSKANPFEAEITELVNLNGSRSSKQTFHLELNLGASGLTYQPGDALGIVPRNDPRLVEQVMQAAGLADDDGLREALATRHDLNTLTGHLIGSLADAAGHAGLRTLADDKDALSAYLPGRHVIDLLHDHPVRVSADQLKAVLRPLAPRLYSIASSQRLTEDEAHVLVGAVRYATHGRDRAGVASTWLADRRRVGDTLPVYVKPNQHFRLPADPATPLIMIGPGTGVAPFRAFLQDRDATEAGGRTWLFCGDRNYTHDFLYQLEWQDYLARGVLSRLDAAFSRDQDAKRYVQHAMLERGGELYAWLQDGARIYVCGDQSSMARDVNAALTTILATHGKLSPERAEAELQSLKAQGRYLLDVY